MRNKIGTICMVCGAALVLAALSLFLWNQWESNAAGAAAEKILSKVIKQIEIPDVTVPDPYDFTMTEVEIDGYAYVGYLSIPAIGVELPVLSECDDTRLKIAPCRYAGSTKSDDLVICAHNYVRLFGQLKRLSVGDTVVFTDMDDVVSTYQVVGTDILDATAVKEMTAGAYDLTLFTCTYSGANRVTVRCERTPKEHEERGEKVEGEQETSN